jgi:hypothetical protein
VGATDFKALAIGVPSAFLLAFVGLIIGAWFAQFISPPSPTVFLVPLALNIGLGWAFVRMKQKSIGKIILYGGSMVSIALPFLLL